ncbi:uncharacterized protein LOC131884176 [Tigriopus californicus]|uniref:uncharacterized protein LOC131884176 n=1 Tax=Tigriopus californicus TaxID=6832 RepID=UPI0027DAA7F8|nr:uncharacterized protein LOC131884176 [Tigriopus californicus]
MKVLCIISAILAMSALTRTQEASKDGIIQKAPSNVVNCNCQCDNYTYTNHKGQIQGNCKSADQTYGLWCYVDRQDDCSDIRYSRDRVDSYGNKRKWSYQACSTPALNSYECRNGNYGNGNTSGGGRRPNRPNRPNRRPNNNRPGNQGLGNTGSLGELLGLGVRDGAANAEAPKKANTDGLQFQ